MSADTPEASKTTSMSVVDTPVHEAGEVVGEPQGSVPRGLPGSTMHSGAGSGAETEASKTRMEISLKKVCYGIDTMV